MVLFNFFWKLVFILLIIFTYNSILASQIGLSYSRFFLRFQRMVHITWLSHLTSLALISTIYFYPFLLGGLLFDSAVRALLVFNNLYYRFFFSSEEEEKKPFFFNYRFFWAEDQRRKKMKKIWKNQWPVEEKKRKKWLLEGHIFHSTLHIPAILIRSYITQNQIFFTQKPDLLGQNIGGDYYLSYK